MKPLRANKADGHTNLSRGDSLGRRLGPRGSSIWQVRIVRARFALPVPLPRLRAWDAGLAGAGALLSVGHCWASSFFGSWDTTGALLYHGVVALVGWRVRWLEFWDPCLEGISDGSGLPISFFPSRAGDCSVSWSTLRRRNYGRAIEFFDPPPQRRNESSSVPS